MMVIKNKNEPTNREILEIMQRGFAFIEDQFTYIDERFKLTDARIDQRTGTLNERMNNFHERLIAIENDTGPTRVAVLEMRARFA